MNWDRFGQFYWHHFLVGFCGHVPLLVTALLLLGSMTATFGSGFGLPGLVWHDRWACQFGVGLAFGLVWVQALLVGFLLRSEKTTPSSATESNSTTDETTPTVHFPTYASLISACVVGTAITLALVLRGLSAGRDWLFGTFRHVATAPADPQTWADVSYGLPFLGGFVLALLATSALGLVTGEKGQRWVADGLVKVAHDLGTWLPRRGGTLLLGLVLVNVGLYQALMFLESISPRWWNDWLWTCVLLLGVALLAVYLLLFVALIPEAQRKEDVPSDRVADLGFGYLYFPLGVLLLVAVAAVTGLGSPLASLGLAVFVLLAIYGVLASVVRRLAPIFFVAVALLLLLAGLPVYRYPIPGLEEYYRNPVKLLTVDFGAVPAEQVGGPLPPLIQLKDLVFTPGPGDGRRGPLVIVAASGGGIRAAAWTVRVLQRLEMDFAAENLDFPAHVRLITGASGGMVGGAIYTAGLRQSGRLFAAGAEGARADLAGADQSTTDRQARFAAMRGRFSKVSEDTLTPVVNTMVFRDLPSFFSPWNRGYDRGRRLEDAWNDTLGGLLNVSFSDLFAAEKAGKLPSLLFSPMLVEDGRRLVISNLDLADVIRSEGNQLCVDDTLNPLKATYSREAIEMFRVFPAAHKTLTLATAARLSASFPYITPAAHLPTDPRRRVVDAGYYDDYGVSLATSWLNSPDTRDWIRDHASGIVLIQIRDTPSEHLRRTLRLAPDRSTVPGRAVEQLTTPPEGLWAMRDASSSFRNDAQLALLSRYYNNRQGVQQDRQAAQKTLGDLIAGTEDRVKHEAKSPTEAIQIIKDAVSREFSTVLKNLDAEHQIDSTPQTRRFFTVVTFELAPGDDVPLSWYLTDREQRMIEKVAPYPEKIGQGRPGDGNPDSALFNATVAELLAWWRDPSRAGANPILAK
jgi:hypothetical protein